MSLRAAIKERRARRAEEGASKSALKSNDGFTLTEALATVVIVGLVTCILASGIVLATRQYTQSMINSESQMLFSSLQKILETELAYTSDVEGSGPDDNFEITGFSSRHYKARAESGSSGSLNPVATEKLCTLNDTNDVQDMAVPGRLAMASNDGKVQNPFLGKGSYNYGLKAYIKSISLNKRTGVFTVTLGISRNSDTNPLIEETFTVNAMNKFTYGNNGGVATDNSSDITPGGGVSGKWKWKSPSNSYDLDVGDVVFFSSPVPVRIIVKTSTGSGEGSTKQTEVVSLTSTGGPGGSYVGSFVVNKKVANGYLYVEVDDGTISKDEFDALIAAIQIRKNSGNQGKP